MKSTINLLESIRNTLNEDLIKIYYIPHRDWQGSWGLSQFKNELKRRGISVVTVESSVQYHRYGSPEKYYMFYIPKSQEEAVSNFVNYAQDIVDVSLDPPTY